MLIYRILILHWTGTRPFVPDDKYPNIDKGTQTRRTAAEKCRVSHILSTDDHDVVVARSPTGLLGITKCT